MSQLPQNNEVFDDNPEYAKLHPGNNNGQSAPGNQPLPTRQFYPSYPRNIVGPVGILEEGRKLAQRSLTFGIISVVLILLTFLLPYTLLDLLFWASWESCLHETRNVTAYRQRRGISSAGLV